MLIKAQINASLYDVRGWVVGIEINAHLDNTQDLSRQCEAEIIDWISRRERVHGQVFKLSGILSVIFEKGGFWYVVKADDGIQWPKHV